MTACKAAASPLETAGAGAPGTAAASPRGTALLCMASLLLAGAAGAQQKITLTDAVAMAQRQSHMAVAAEATRDAARADNTAFSRRNLPQFTVTGTAPQYQKEITPAPQQDGSLAFKPVQITRTQAGLTVSQRIPFTGADFSVTSSLQRLNVTGENAVEQWSSTPVRFQITQPILQPNAHRWDSRAQDVEITAAERQYLEAREGVALAASNAFFDVYIAKRSLDNAIFNAATNDTLYNLNKGRLEIGKIGENDLLQSELALLQARQALDNARLEYDRAMSQLRITLNMQVGNDLEIEIPAGIPAIDADTNVAVEQALRNRAQVSQLDLQKILADRQVAAARLGGIPNASVTAGFGLNQTAPDMSNAYRELLESQSVSLAFNIPLFSWGARRADLEQARMNARRVDAQSKATREQMIQDAHFAVLQLALAKRNVEISAKADTVAQKRFEVAYNRYVIGRIGVDNLYIAQNEKDAAVNRYLQALKGYWGAYYRLRQATLYDFENRRPIE